MCYLDVFMNEWFKGSVGSVNFAPHANFEPLFVQTLQFRMLLQRAARRRLRRRISIDSLQPHLGVRDAVAVGSAFMPVAKPAGLTVGTPICRDIY